MPQPIEHSDKDVDLLVKQALEDIRCLHQIVNELGVDTAALTENDIVSKIKQTQGFTDMSDEMLASLAGIFKEIERGKF